MEKIEPIDGLTLIESRLDHTETVKRISAVLSEKNMQIFAHIDHAGAASQVGMMLEPTDLILFGNPSAGTILMQDRQSVGIDLPLKVLVWTTAQGQTLVGYNRSVWIGERHHLRVASQAPVMRMTELLAAIAASVEH